MSKLCKRGGGINEPQGVCPSVTEFSFGQAGGDLTVTMEFGAAVPGDWQWSLFVAVNDGPSQLLVIESGGGLPLAGSDTGLAVNAADVVVGVWFLRDANGELICKSEPLTYVVANPFSLDSFNVVGDFPSRFEWTYSGDSSEAADAILEWSNDGATWNLITHVNIADNLYQAGDQSYTDKYNRLTCYDSGSGIIGQLTLNP